MTTSPSIKQFKKEITKKYIKTSNEEIISMFKEGNITDVVNSLLPMVIYVVDKYNYQNDTQFEDLVSVGNEGLMKGINRFDINRSSNIISYCKAVINFEILQYLSIQKDFIKITSSKQRLLARGVVLPTVVEVNDITEFDYIDEEYFEINVTRQELSKMLMTIPNLKEKEVDIFLDYFYLPPRFYKRYIYNRYKITKKQLNYIVSKIIKKIRSNPQLTEKFRDLFF